VSWLLRILFSQSCGCVQRRASGINPEKSARYSICHCNTTHCNTTHCNTTHCNTTHDYSICHCNTTHCNTTHCNTTHDYSICHCNTTHCNTTHNTRLNDCRADVWKFKKSARDSICKSSSRFKTTAELTFENLCQRHITLRVKRRQNSEKTALQWFFAANWVESWLSRNFVSDSWRSVWFAKLWKIGCRLIFRCVAVVLQCFAARCIVPSCVVCSSSECPTKKSKMYSRVVQCVAYVW